MYLEVCTLRYVSERLYLEIHILNVVPRDTYLKGCTSRYVSQSLYLEICISKVVPRDTYLKCCTSRYISQSLYLEICISKVLPQDTYFEACGTPRDTPCNTLWCYCPSFSTLLIGYLQSSITCVDYEKTQTVGVS